MYLLNNNLQWTGDAKGELNVPTQNSIFRVTSAKLNIATYKIINK